MELIKKNKELIILAILALFVRFSYQLPVLFIDDSVKFFVPLQIVYDHNFSWILSTINFSLFDRIISYFVQSLDNGSVANMITLQKLFGTLSTIVFYKLSLNLTNQRKLLSLIMAIFFSLNPLMLYIEQLIMPEALFMFMQLLASLLLYKFLEINTPIKYAYGVGLGILAGLIVITKHSGETWSNCLIATVLIIGIFQFFKEKNKNLIILGVILLSMSFLIKLPIMLHNYQKHKAFTVSLFDVKGALLLALTPEMIECNPTDKYPFLTTAIKQYSAYFETQYKGTAPVATEEQKLEAFTKAVYTLNIPGREGQLQDPITGGMISSKQWSKITAEYFVSTVIKNPLRTLERIWKISLPNLINSNNLTLNEFRRSSRPGLNYDVMQFTLEPYSFTERLDPKLKNSRIVKGAEIEEFKEHHEKEFLIMRGRETNEAFVIEKQGISLWLQDLFTKFSPDKITLTLFVLSLIYFLINIRGLKPNLFQIYILATTAVYFFLPLLITGGEPRYRLQFIPFMLLFISYVLATVLNKRDGNYENN